MKLCKRLLSNAEEGSRISAHIPKRETFYSDIICQCGRLRAWLTQQLEQQSRIIHIVECVRNVYCLLSNQVPP